MNIDSVETKFVATYTAFGVPFRLCSNSLALLEAMTATLPYGSAPASVDATGCDFILTDLTGRLGTEPPGGNYRLIAAEEEHISPNLYESLEQLRGSLMVHVANYAADRVFVHAGVVAWHGRAVLFPGLSFAGKTTLVAECVRAGATYFSDEYAVLDAKGMVHPYPRDLQMRQPGRPEQTGVPVTHLHGTVATASAPVAQVIFAEYVQSASWQPEPVSAGLAVLEMLHHTIPVQRTPARVLSTLATMMDIAKACRSQRGEASKIVQQLLTSLERQH